MSGRALVEGGALRNGRAARAIFDDRVTERATLKDRATERATLVDRPTERAIRRTAVNPRNPTEMADRGSSVKPAARATTSWLPANDQSQSR
jgi:hypothetical protein